MKGRNHSKQFKHLSIGISEASSLTHANLSHITIYEFTLLSASWVIRARWREIQRFVRKFKTMKSIHDVILGFLFCKTEGATE